MEKAEAQKNKENSSVRRLCDRFHTRLAPPGWRRHTSKTRLCEQAQYFHIIRAAQQNSPFIHSLSAQKAEKMLFCLARRVCVCLPNVWVHTLYPRAARCSPSWLLSHPNWMQCAHLSAECQPWILNGQRKRNPPHTRQLLSVWRFLWLRFELFNCSNSFDLLLNAHL